MKAVMQAIYHRLEHAHPEIFTKHGTEAVYQAMEDEASFVGEVNEIGSSDVSIWTKNVINRLQGTIDS